MSNDFSQRCKNKFENYPYVFLSAGTIIGIIPIILAVYFHFKINEIAAFSIIMILCNTFVHGFTYSAIYIVDDKIIFKSFLGRKKILLIENLVKLDAIKYKLRGESGPGYFFNDNVKILFMGSPGINYKKIDEYKKFVSWLKEYKVSMFPSSDRIEIIRLFI